MEFLTQNVNLNDLQKNKSIFTVSILLFIITTYFLSERSITKYYALNSGIDLAIFENVFYNTLQGNFLFTSLGPFDAPHSYLADHLNLTMLLFLPAYYFYPDPKTLLIQQSVILFSPLLIFPILFKTKYYFSKLSFLLLYALYLPLYWIGIFDFHPEVLFIPFFFLFYYFYSNENLIGTIIFLLLCLLTKEEISFVFIVFSIIFFKRNNKFSKYIFIIAIAYLPLSLIVISYFNPVNFSPIHFSRFMKFTNNDPIFYSLIFFLFIQLGFFPLVSRWSWVLLPYFGYSYLSSSTFNKTPLTHHSFIAAAPIFLGLYDLLENIVKDKFISSVNLLLLIVSITFFAFVGPPSKKFSFQKDYFKSVDNSNYIHKLRNYNKDAQVVTNSPEFLANRQNIRYFLNHAIYQKNSIFVLVKKEKDSNIFEAYLENCKKNILEETEDILIAKCNLI